MRLATTGWHNPALALAGGESPPLRDSESL